MDGWTLISQMWCFQSSAFNSVLNHLVDQNLHPKALIVLNAIGSCRFPNEVAKSLCVPMPTLSNILRELERNGYVTRQVDPQDRRRVILSRTEEGEKAYQAIVSAINEALAKPLAEYQGAPLHDAMNALEAIGHKLHEADGKGAIAGKPIGYASSV